MVVSHCGTSLPEGEEDFQAAVELWAIQPVFPELVFWNVQKAGVSLCPVLWSK